MRKTIILVAVVLGLMLAVGIAGWAHVGGGRDAAARGEVRTQLESFWEDDVLTSAEIDQLRSGHWLGGDDGSLMGALADGQITRDEFEELHEESRSGHSRRAGHRGHHGRGG